MPFQIRKLELAKCDDISEIAAAKAEVCKMIMLMLCSRLRYSVYSLIIHQLQLSSVSSTTLIIAERQSVRRINNALVRFYSTLVYVLRTYICL